MPKVIDLFAGVGGLTCGLKQAGLDVICGYDIEPSCVYPYQKNNSCELKLKDVRELKGRELNELYKKNNAKIKILVGCAPCQPFSKYQKRKEHPDYDLVNEFRRVIIEVQPDIISMENVAGMLKTENFLEFVRILKEDYDYFIDYKVVNIADYGLPQNRKRLVLLGCKSSYGEIRIPKIENPILKTVSQAIGHLPQLKNGEKSSKDALHVCSKLSEINMERIQQSKPGGTWKDWDDKLLPNCYRKPSGQTFSSVYGRLSSNKKAGTLTTQFTRYGSGRFGHYEQDRALSLREGAILQSFPDNYIFCKDNDIKLTKISRMIGNAVPPLLGKVIGEEINKLIRSQDE